MDKTILNVEKTQEAFDEAIGIAIDGAESIADLGQLFDAIRETATENKGIQRLASIGMFLANECEQAITQRTEQFKVENNVE